jgi:nicotinamidase/pyrazinamidase
MSGAKQQVVIVVDFQADFTELRKGALAVPDTGQDYVEEVIASTRRYKEQGLPILATRDYHPLNHISFYTRHEGKKAFDVIEVSGRKQVLWPPHCVQGTDGAKILLPSELITAVVSTGEDADFESYSGFRDDAGRDTGMKALLEGMGAAELIVYGLATDYCVRATVLHALEEGYAVVLISRLSKGITPESTRAALEEMQAAGAVIV